jgi:hypothetical protein
LVAVAVGRATTVVAATAVAVTFAVTTTATVVVAAGAAVAIAFAYGSDEITGSVRHYALFRLRNGRGFVLIARLDRQGRYGYQAEYDCFQGCFDHDVVPLKT